jgi:hypothetical protein
MFAVHADGGDADGLHLSSLPRRVRASSNLGKH